MASAFDEIEPLSVKYITNALWAGESIAEIARECELKPSLVTRMRDELFAAFSDPEAVKAAANGPLINAHCINRPKAKRKSRKGKTVQIEMFA